MAIENTREAVSDVTPESVRRALGALKEGMGSVVQVVKRTSSEAGQGGENIKKGLASAGDMMSQTIMAELSDSPLMMAGLDIGKGITKDIGKGFGSLFSKSEDKKEEGDDKTETSADERVEKQTKAIVKSNPKEGIFSSMNNKLGMIYESLTGQKLEEKKSSTALHDALTGGIIVKAPGLEKAVGELAPSTEEKREASREDDLSPKKETKKTKKVGFFGKIFDKIKIAAMGIFSIITKSLLGIGKFLLKRVAPWAIAATLAYAIFSSFDNIADGMKKMWAGSEGDNIVLRIGGAIAGGLAGLGEGILDAFGIDPKILSDFGRLAGSAVFDFFTSVGVWFDEAMVDVGVVFANLIPSIGKGLTDILSWVGDKFSSIGDDIMGYINQAIPWVSNIAGFIGDKLTKSIMSIVGLVTNVLTNISTFISSAMDNVLASISTMVINPITDATVGDYFDFFGDAAKRVEQANLDKQVAASSKPSTAAGVYSAQQGLNEKQTQKIQQTTISAPTVTTTKNTTIKTQVPSATSPEQSHIGNQMLQAAGA